MRNTENSSLSRVELEAWKDNVLLHAQLDLVMLYEYIIGASDSYDRGAFIGTLDELISLTGDSTGKKYLK